MCVCSEGIMFSLEDLNGFESCRMFLENLFAKHHETYFSCIFSSFLLLEALRYFPPFSGGFLHQQLLPTGFHLGPPAASHPPLPLVPAKARHVLASWKLEHLELLYHQSEVPGEAFPAIHTQASLRTRDPLRWRCLGR